MKWIYILECRHYKTHRLYYYIGQTKRLYSRFDEHFNGSGCINTSIYIPKSIVGIYKLQTLGKFLDYFEYIDNNDIYTLSKIKNVNNTLKHFNDCYNEYQDENYDEFSIETFIAEVMMINNSKYFTRIRGGKYTRFDIEYKYPDDPLLNKLPLCNCGLPCDVKCKENSHLFFRCSKKNMWDDLTNKFEVKHDPCNFYQAFIDDKNLRKQRVDSNEEFRKLYKESYNWLKNIPTHKSRHFGFPAYCICSTSICGDDDKNNMIIENGCNKYKEQNMMSVDNEKLCLCFDCFKKYNKELKLKFSKKSQYNFIDSD